MKILFHDILTHFQCETHLVKYDLFSPFLHTGLLVDIYGDYKYLFLMCGAVIFSGGLFLFVMNTYNYHMLEKEKQKQVRASEVEMKQIPEAEMGQTEPEAKEKNGALRDPENTETPNDCELI